jgi:quercetin dioxygenase-like cupin family protein
VFATYGFYILTTLSITAKIKIMYIRPETYSNDKKPARMAWSGWCVPVVSHWGLKVFFLFVCFLIVSGCKTIEKPSEFVESLRNPTSFPEIFFPATKDIDEIVKENKLAEDENIKVIPIGESKSTSVYLIQVRGNAEMDAHYHKLHDEMVYVKKGSGVLMLDGTRYGIRDGMLLIIPRMTVHKFINTGSELNIAISVFSPTFNGEDIELIAESHQIEKKKRTIYDKVMKEREQEKAAVEG